MNVLDLKNLYKSLADLAFVMYEETGMEGDHVSSEYYEACHKKFLKDLETLNTYPNSVISGHYVPTFLKEALSAFDETEFITFVTILETSKKSERDKLQSEIDELVNLKAPFDQAR